MGQLPFASTQSRCCNAQRVVYLLLELGVRVDFVRHGNCLRGDSKCGAGRQRRLTKPPYTGTNARNLPHARHQC